MPNVTYVDRPGEHWRPGVIWEITGATATVRIARVGGPYRDYTVATSSLPSLSIGSPIVAKFTSEAFEPIADLQAGEWNSGEAPRGAAPNGDTEERDAVRRGVFYVGVIPRRITGEPEEKAWTRG